MAERGIDIARWPSMRAWPHRLVAPGFALPYDLTAKKVAEFQACA